MRRQQIKDEIARLDKQRRTTDKDVAVYCRSGKRSRTAAEILIKKGFKVYNLD